ncbi:MULTISPECIES: MGMT family protein [Shouchella]|uniref:6-O-methylguanine DNA methyltransferase n=4 Tax=Bacillaceae TaxID=186817 RepID=Q5WH49_SHOC1|nr:MGMT family protein [Shouchella clausii]MCM3312543.1 methylated-DNA--[protein]-cysteine S-methyltransferase [Psychrobacillus sp. MER TA 17]SHL02233.1 methylated-DNA-protein-cysteine methyltransferase related protein [Shouchella rhizosphaerae]BAD64306.1 6-O-methylguanine DNA methyltransferase [Shouchella clausii KSM-K16]ALA51054.1 Methylated-DNA-[protein]-cysteine S-methyltransferase [Shouchella clausii]KKI85635.1 cysteine methyltransferase [Shouchella clausii]
MMDAFFEHVYTAVRRIPRGEVASYGQIARYLHAPRHARVVGWAMRQSPPDVPAHRVVKQNGELASGLLFNGKTQKERLLEEGVTFSQDGRVAMELHSWTACPL